MRQVSGGDRHPAAMALAAAALHSTWEGLNSTAAAQKVLSITPLQGIECPAVGLGTFEHDGHSVRGARAIRELPVGSEVCVIPVQNMLSEYTIGNSSLAGCLLQPATGSHRNELSLVHGAFATFVLREAAQESSPWNPYIEGLLRGHMDAAGTIPGTWPPGDPRLEALSPLGKQLATSARTNALRAYKQLFGEAPPTPRCKRALHEGAMCGSPRRACAPQELYSEERFIAAYFAIRARDWVLDMYGTPRSFLAPVLDLLNHGQVGIRTGFLKARHAFVARTTSKIDAGAELLFYYGAFCKERMLDMYGFATPTAPKCTGRRAGHSRGAKPGGKPGGFRPKRVPLVRTGPKRNVPGAAKGTSSAHKGAHMAAEKAKAARKSP